MLTEREPSYGTPTPDPAPRRSRSRWRGPLAAVATVLLVAMAASVFAFMSARSAGTGNGKHAAKATRTPGVTRVAAIQPPNTFLPMPANAYLTDISLSSAHDGWAVGGIINSTLPPLPGQPAIAAQGVLVHYHDGIWMSARDSFPNISLDGVSMLSASDGWAVGRVGNASGTDRYTGAVLLHFTGGHWRMVSAPALANTHPRVIRMLSPDFGYITGEMDVANADKSIDQFEFVAVYQNGEWKTIRVPFANAPVAAFTTQTVMVSPSEGWTSAVEDLTKPGGVQNQRATIYHYLNGVWTKSLTIEGWVTSLNAASPSDVWALAVQCVNCTEPMPRIEHYNGSIWERVNPPSQSDFSKIPGFGAGKLAEQSIFDGAGSGVWVRYTAQGTAKPTSQSTAMWEYINGGWRLMSQPIIGSEVMALAADSNGGLWAITLTGSPFTTLVLYSQGKDWKVYGRSR